MVMMAALAAAAGIVLIAFGFLRGRPEPALFGRRSRLLLGAAFVLMGALAGFWAFFGIGEMAGGDRSGAMHLVPALIIVLLVLAVRRRPREGGVVLLVIGTLVAISALGAYRGGWGRYIMVALVTGAPLIAAGVLLLLATAVGARPKAPSDGPSSQ